MIKVFLKDRDSPQMMTLKAFEEKLNLYYIRKLEFQNNSIIAKVLKQSIKAIKKKELSIREKWLSSFFQKEVSSGFQTPFSIRWIDEVLKYGVFAEKDIPIGGYIGEYTGLVRKRRGRRDRKNDYCFEYTIGDWVYNPFIIDAKEAGNFTRFINHSDDPNSESLAVYVDGVMHIIFIALKPIKAGEQICYHYGDTFWKKRRHEEIVTI